MDIGEAIERAEGWGKMNAVRPEPQVVKMVVSRLLDHIEGLTLIATGQVMHLYRGMCPDGVEGTATRDPECPACKLLMPIGQPAQ